MQYEATYIPGLDFYGIVWVKTGMFEPDLYFTDAVSAVYEAESMNEDENG